MKFLFISIGTRGDMEPFLAVAEFLRERGHHVACAFPEQFATLAEDSGIHCYPLSGDFIKMIGSEAGQFAMGGNVPWWRKLYIYFHLYRSSKELNNKMLGEQEAIVLEEKPDKIVYGGKAIYPIIWGIRHPGRAVALSPVPCLIHPVWELPHVGFNPGRGSLFNRMTYWLGNLSLVKHVAGTTRELRAKMGIKHNKIKSAILDQTLIYTVSPSLFARREYWPDHVHVVGYRERNRGRNWQPESGLTRFLKRHEKILFVTFGSMLNPNPALATGLLIHILQKQSIPAIINTAMGGLEKPADYNHELFYFVDNIPYEWIFPRVYGVIHHGGAGTTHSVMKHGCTSLIIPHIIDQYLWNSVLEGLGVGPLGCDMKNLSEDYLAPRIADLYHRQSYKEKAHEIAARMEDEELDEELFRILIS